jgi:hypothetical protein
MLARQVRRTALLAGAAAVGLCLTLFAGAPAVLAAPDLPPNTLFALERSLNANIVVYEAMVNGDGTFPAKNPVVVYWIRLADKGQREELNFIEKSKAYGIDVGPDGGGALKLVIKALPKRPMRVVTEEGKPLALLAFSGKEAIVKRVFVKSKEGGFLPSVEYVDIFGVTRDGTAVTERIIP